jgi:DNA-binding NarL/FixJ family response regulator
VRGLTVLIADDDPAFRSALRLLLEAEDAVVVGEARDGGEAVELAASLAPDVLLIDYQMPVLDGVSATSIVARRWPNVCVVFLSGTAHPDARTRAFAAGAAAYIDKSELSSVVALTSDAVLASRSAAV